MYSNRQYCLWLKHGIEIEKCVVDDLTINSVNMINFFAMSPSPYNHVTWLGNGPLFSDHHHETLQDLKI